MKTTLSLWPIAIYQKVILKANTILQFRWCF